MRIRHAHQGSHCSVSAAGLAPNAVGQFIHANYLNYLCLLAPHHPAHPNLPREHLIGWFRGKIFILINDQIFVERVKAVTVGV